MQCLWTLLFDSGKSKIHFDVLYIQALLHKHQRSEHGDDPTEKQTIHENESEVEAPVCCPTCEIVVNNDYALAVHLSSVHGVERPWACKVRLLLILWCLSMIMHQISFF